MACRDKRTYLQDPNQPGFALPTVPTNPNSWDALQTFLVEAKDRLESAINRSLFATSSPSLPPNQVQGFAGITGTSGVLLLWEHSYDAAFYAIYRSEVPTFGNSRLIVSQYADPQKNQFYDVGGQSATGTPRYYWIRAYSRNNVPGPLSPVVVTADPGAGAVPVTSFSDDFTGAAAENLGNDYLTGPRYQGVNAVINVDRLTRSGSGTCVLIGASGSSNNLAAYIGWPIPVIASLNGVSQFAQITCTASSVLTTVGIISGGIFVLAHTNSNGGFRAYGLTWNGADGGAAQNSWVFGKYSANVFTAIGTGASGSLVAGQVIRLEADVVDASQTNVRAYVDGVQVSSIDDNTASRSSLGPPAIGRRYWISNAAPGTRTMTFDDFSCGAL